MKKIAFVYDAIYPYVKGGGEVRFYELGKRLAQKGYEVHFYGMKYWNGEDNIKQKGMYYHGLCKAINLYTTDGKRSIWQAIYFGIACFKLLSEEFDVMDCCGFPYFSLFSSKFVCLMKRKILYSTWHEVWGKDYWKEYLGNFGFVGYVIEKISVNLPDHIIAVSNKTALMIRTELGYTKKISIVSNGIDFDQIQTIQPAKEKSDIIYAGRLMDFKNIDILIEAIALIRNVNQNIKCIIIGDGPEKERLIKLSKKLRLEHTIRFLGFQQNRYDVFSYLKSSKVFVLPSVREGFGIGVLEALACSLLIVTVNHKDNSAKDLINEKINGYIARLDPVDISKKILASLALKDKNSIQIQNTLSKFDWNNITRKVINLYI